MNRYIKLYIAVAVIFLVGIIISQTNEPTARTSWYETKQWIKTGAITFTNKTLTSPTLTSPSLTSPDITSGTLTMANDEVLSNATDADVLVIFNDDAATLGQFFISSSVDTPNIADNDNFEIVFRHEGESSTTTDWVKIISTSTDVTENSKDSKIGFQVYTANTASVPLELTGNTLTLDQGETIDNAVDGTIGFTANVLKHSYDAAAYWTATQADGGSVTLNSTSDGTAGFTFSDNVQVNGTINYLGASNNVAGTDSFIVTPTYTTTLATGGMYVFKADTINTGACVLGIVGVDTVSLKKLTDQDPGNSHIEANSMIMMIFDGTNMQIQTPAAN